MNDRKDSRTDEQRQTDIEAEREIHRTRREQGLPPIHYSVDIQVTVRDVTDDDVKAITTALHEAAQRAATERALDRYVKRPFYSGSVITVNRKEEVNG